LTRYRGISILPLLPLPSAEFAAQTELVLTEAGLAGQFDIALSNLAGEGLKEPTLAAEAKFGAALVVLAFGIINGIEAS
jgi:hypothetical protein